MLLKDGEGYSLRSANTGEYLQADFSDPASGKTRLYIQSSPNNTGTQQYVNVSSSSDFSGKTCLNLGQDGKTLYEWTYSGDSGSDWLIESADNFDLETVRTELLAMSPYVGTLEDGAYYRIVSSYDLVITGGTSLSTMQVDESNYYQYWQLHQSGSGWTIQDVVTQNYVQRQNSTSAAFVEGTAAIPFNIQAVDDDWDYKWTIVYGSETAGFHDSSSQGHSVVRWSTTADASIWHFEKVELSEEEIAAARGQQNVYEDLVANQTALQTSLDNLFEDKACTTLKAEIQALSDDELAANEDFAALSSDMQAMVLKVKNDTWQQYTLDGADYTAGYEKFFRVYDYGSYSNCDLMGNADNFTMSNAFGRLSGPTGIVADAGDIIYIYVDSNPKSGSTLQLESVGTDGVAGNHASGDVATLKAGLNLFRFSEQKMLYILHQVTSTKRKLADFPAITIHIEGGQLHGYWDATRGMTNNDWKLLQQDLLKASPFLNLKTERLVFQMDAELVKASEPDEMEGLMHIWNTVCANQDRYMGVEDFDGLYNNVWNVFSGGSNYMHSSTRGTWYTESTIGTIMNYTKMSTEAGNLWGPSHEIGHNHQGSINAIGLTESSNNLFSNINTFESGIQNSRRYYPSSNFDYMVDQTPWLQRNIWMTTGLFYQLYLYFHVQHHNDNFLPDLFRLLRKDPLNKGTWNGSISWTSSDGEEGTGAYVGTGYTDYLKLAKKICDAAQADLSEFFEAYGMFIPVKQVHVGDYSNYVVTTTQAMIDNAKSYMQKYEKKLGNIMFIDDRVIRKKADPDNIFGCVVASDGWKRANSEYPYLMLSSTSSYVGGDYEAYTDDAEPVTDDWYRVSANGKNIAFYGTKNYAGHKFYDADGNLIWATVKPSDTLPQVVIDLGMENVTVKTAMYDMTDAICTTTKPDPDAIAEVASENTVGNKVMYDLTGRRVDNATRGLYIVGGKKVFIK
ncbi:MAG: M60 family metallopeptidase [Bacteroidales bacterium]|nr:M60 family metallopeptidase [Bacteroidales bacterium]